MSQLTYEQNILYNIPNCLQDKNREEKIEQYVLNKAYYSSKEFKKDAEITTYYRVNLICYSVLSFVICS